MHLHCVWLLSGLPSVASPDKMSTESSTSRSCIQIWLERDSRATCIGSLSWAEPSQAFPTFRQVGSFRVLHWPSTSEIRPPASRLNAPTPSRTRANVRIPSNQNNLAVSNSFLRHVCRYAETESDLTIGNRGCDHIWCLMSVVGGQTAHDPARGLRLGCASPPSIMRIDRSALSGSHVWMINHPLRGFLRG